MKRLTRPNISVDKDTDRYLNAKIGEREFEWSTASDRVIDLILNGPALMGFSKDVLRKIIRELYVRLKPYEDLGLEPWQADAAKSIVDMAFEDKPERAERIRDLMRADKEGRIVVLPCKVGDTIWRLKRTFETYPDRSKPYVEPDAFLLQDVWDAGKTVFLSREEAEKALAKMEAAK